MHEARVRSSRRPDRTHIPAKCPCRAGRSHRQACERLATRVPSLSFSCLTGRVSGPAPLVFADGRAAKKYNRFTMEIARQLQCKALRSREKSRRRNNNGKQWKKQCAEQWKQSDIRARADASPGHIGTHKNKSPAAERRRAHRSKTRISAIAHSSAGRTLKKRSRYSRRDTKEACNTRSYAIVLPRSGHRFADEDMRQKTTARAARVAGRRMGTCPQSRRCGARSLSQACSSGIASASRSCGVADASSTHWRSSGPPLMTSMASLPRSYS